MAYLFGTDVLSNLIRPRPLVALLARLASIGESEQATTSITLGEVMYGAYRSPRRAEILALVEDRLVAALPIVPFDATAGRLYGRLRAELEAGGEPLAEADVRIASIALARDFTLVTGNTRHFSRVPGLRVENWLRDDE